MSSKEVVRALRRYQNLKPSSPARRAYLRSYLPKMVYRTTKTEHAEATQGMVKKVLERLQA